jgi:hypothetical protein
MHLQYFSYLRLFLLGYRDEEGQKTGVRVEEEIPHLSLT